MSRLVNNSFKEEVFRIVRSIPSGNVMTYGQIAVTLGKPQWSRQVGWALHQNKQSLRSSASPAGLKDPKTPCHRVVDRNGRLAPNFAFDGAVEQRKRLEAENVKFRDKMHVALSKCLWKENY